MKNYIKVLSVILSFILITGSCRKTVDNIPFPENNINNKSSKMNFLSLASQKEKQITFKVLVIPGNKYSIQIVDINGEAKLVKGLNADEEIENVIIDIEKVNVGMYDLIFIDTQGNEIKQPLKIK